MNKKQESKQAEITFEPSGRHGLIAVGTYLADAAARLGVTLHNEDEELEAKGIFFVKITNGADLLSEITSREKKQLTAEKIAAGERIAGQAKIIKSGEISIMVSEKKKKEEPEEKAKMDEFQKQFAELPLEKKVANLLEMEMATLGETVSFVLNSPYLVVGKIMDVMAEFGIKLEKDAKKSKRPEEHHADDEKFKADADDSAKEAGKTSKAKASTTGKTVKSPTDKTEEDKAN